MSKTARDSMAAHFEALRRIAESNRKARLDSLADDLIREADLTVHLSPIAEIVRDHYKTQGFADRYAPYLDSMNRPTYTSPRVRVS